MRILIISYLFPNRKNINRGIFNLSRAKALAKQGHEVCIISPISLNPERKYFWPKLQFNKQLKTLIELFKLPFEEYVENIQTFYPKWIRLPDKIFYKYHSVILYLFAGRKINKIVNDFQPDLIIGTWINPYAVYAKHMKKRYNTPFFALAEGSDILINLKKYKSTSYISKLIKRYCDLLIVVSQDMYEKIRISKLIDNIKLIENGFDSQCFSFDYNNDNNNGVINLVNVANFNYEKGQDVLIEAMKLLDTKYRLLLIGEGPLLEKCKKEVDKNGLSDKIKFTGRIEHNRLSEYLSNQHLFCLPSRSEGLPAAPLEAMSMGLPVVATNVGGMRFIINEGFNGLLCKKESPEDIASKIIDASKLNWNREKISQWVISNYGWDKWADEVVKTYYQYSAKLS